MSSSLVFQPIRPVFNAWESSVGFDFRLAAHGRYSTSSPFFTVPIRSFFIRLLRRPSTRPNGTRVYTAIIKMYLFIITGFEADSL